MAGERFRSAFTIASFGLATTIVCNAGQFTKLGQYVVSAGELISIGYGNLSGMDNAIGRIYAKFQNATPAAVSGVLRISIVSPQDRPLKIMHEFRTEALDTSSTDRTKQTPLSIGLEDISEDTKIVLEFKPDTTATLTTANCTMVMDITQGVA
jgi:regulator of extracellular matrix RemA (YlzA/DUF370 family)